jgi:uncharacterized protein
MFGLWRTLGLMALGMALYKWDVITGGRSDRFYTWMAVLGFGLGLPVVIAGAWQHFAHDWAMEYSMFIGSVPNYWGSLGVAFGFMAIVMLAVKRSWLSWAQAVLTPVGRMAFTSYILQTVICTTLFYGHGFGLFNRVERWQQALVVLGVWCIVVVFANLWLTRFRMGPLEWAWRSLTYGRLQPMSAGGE